MDGAVRFLTEAGAALRPGQKIRLSTPGLEWVWRTHFRDSGDPADIVTRTYRANTAFYGWGHQFLWSRPMLERYLRGTGFDQLTFHEYGKSDDPTLHGLEQHSDFQVVDGWPSVWIVEATATGARPSDDAAGRGGAGDRALPPGGPLTAQRAAPTPRRTRRTARRANDAIDIVADARASAVRPSNRRATANAGTATGRA